MKNRYKVSKLIIFIKKNLGENQEKNEIRIETYQTLKSKDS